MEIEDHKKTWDKTKLWILLILILMFFIGFGWGWTLKPDKPQEEFNLVSAIASPLFIGTQIYGSFINISNDDYKPKLISFEAITTAYNSVEWQTDSTPCIGAGGYICGMKNVVACPRSIPLGKEIFIDGIPYVCLDRLSEKYDDRFDIFMNYDLSSAKNYGKQIKTISYYD